METISYVIALLLIFWLGTRILKSSSQGDRLRTVPSSATDIKGVFTLILYGNNLDTVAILGKEGGRYTFEPFAPEFAYKIKRGLSANEAVSEAEAFISRHSSFHKTRISGIIDEKGTTLGYEFKPLFLPFDFGTEDVVDVDYKMESNKITAHIHLNPSVEKRMSS